jgi:phosphoribosylanthranilate isomerase
VSILRRGIGKTKHRLRELLNEDRPLIKVCGMFTDDDIRAVNKYHPDFCGFIINVAQHPQKLSNMQMMHLSEALNSDVMIVGVFGDAKLSAVARIAQQHTIDAIQLYGNEDEAYIASLRHLTNIPIIKAFHVEGESDIEAACASSADLVLLDTRPTEHGKRMIETELLKKMTRPYILAGGVNPSNVRKVYEEVHPAGFDMSGYVAGDQVLDITPIPVAVEAVRDLQDQPPLKMAR